MRFTFLSDKITVLEAVEQKDRTEELMKQIVPKDELSNEKVCWLMVEDSAPPYHGGKVIRQVDCTIFF